RSGAGFLGRFALRMKPVSILGTGGPVRPARSTNQLRQETMRRLILVGILLFCGCQNIAGPFQHREPARVDDPLLSISEQKRLGRHRLETPEDPAVPPPPYVDRRAPTGR